MDTFFDICDFFNISPEEFFANFDKKSIVNQTVNEFLELQPDEQLAMRDIIRQFRLQSKD